MSDTKPGEAQIDYERIEALKVDGLSNADAIRKVAEERGKTVNAVRANQHQYRKKLGGSGAGTPRRGSRTTTPPLLNVDDVVAQARGLLEHALAAIDGEVEAAKAELDAVQVRYDELVESVKERKDELEKKIKALA